MSLSRASDCEVDCKLGNLERVKQALAWFKSNLQHADAHATSDSEILRDQYRKAAHQMHGVTSAALITSAAHKHLHIVQWLVNEKLTPYINYRDNRGWSALSSAIVFGNLDIAKWLVNVAGADIKTFDSTGRTVLIEAAGQRKLDIVQWLVEDGRSTISRVDRQGYSALLYAASRAQYHIVQYLLTEAGESVSDALWMKLLQPTYIPWSKYFIYEDPDAASPRPSSLLRTMLFSSHPVPEVVIDARYQNQREFFARTCAHAAKLHIRRPIWLAEQSVMIAESLVWLPSSLVPLVSAYAAPSVDEVWSLVSAEIARPKKKRELQVPRRNPERVARKRRM